MARIATCMYCKKEISWDSPGSKWIHKHNDSMQCMDRRGHTAELQRYCPECGKAVGEKQEDFGWKCMRCVARRQSALNALPPLGNSARTVSGGLPTLGRRRK
jgi:hypothetical protein